MKHFRLLYTLTVLLVYGGACKAMTLGRARDYAASTIELPPLEPGYSAFNPDYSSWYKSQEPSMLSDFFQFIGLYHPLWSPKFFKRLLLDVTRYQQQEGYSEEEDLMIRATEGDEFLLLGPLFGSYHSLVRILSEWKRRGYVNDELKFIRPHMYAVFLGNVIDGSPYIMETLTLVLSLMRANPSKVLYLQGKHEYAGYWLGYGIQQEIETRAQDRSLYSDLKDFFKTLSPSLFMQGPDNNGQLMLFAGRVPLEATLDKACLRKLETTSPDILLACQRTSLAQTVSIKTLFTGDDRLVSFSRHPGLILASSQLGATTWMLFSAPNRVFQRDFSFHYDTFAILTIGRSTDASVLALYHQDVREQTGFKEAACYDPITGKNLVLQKRKAQKVSLLSSHEQRIVEQCAHLKPLERVEHMKVKENPIFIGCSLDLSKGASAIGKPLKMGISLCLSWVNLHGGINGRPVQVVFMDDEYSPEKARANVESFIKTYKSTLFLCNLGSPTLESCIDLIRDNKIFVFFPATDAPLFRTADLVGVVHWSASYKGEGNVLTRYMMDHYHAKKFGFFYQDDVFGRGALEGAQDVLKKEGIKDFVAVPYERNTTAFKQQVEKIKAANVSAVGFFSTSIAAAEFIRQIGVDFFIGRKAFGISDLGEESFQIFAHSVGLDVVVAEDVPNPKTSDLKIVKQFRKALYSQGYVEENVFALNGFISARIMMDILRRVSPDFSHAAINKALLGIKQYPFLGFTLTFNPQTRELSRLLWLDAGGSDWIEQMVKD